MKKTILSAMVLLATWASIQAQTVIFFKPLNPSQFYLDDIWNLTLVQYDGKAEIYLRGEIRQKQEGVVAVMTSENMQVVNETYQLSPFNVKTKSLEINNAYTYADQLRTSKNLPFGNYELCITVFKAKSNEELTSDCKSYEYQPVTPPVLVYPEYCQPLTIKNPVFTWLPPTPLPNNYQVVYDLKICELYAGQSYQDAINRNNPVFAVRDLIQNNYQYPTVAQPFDTTKTYVWQVSARIPRPGDKEIPDDKQRFSSIGVSEVWCFHNKKEKKIEVTAGTTYMYPQHGNANGFVTVQNVLYLGYEEKYGPGKLELSFYDEKGNVIAYDRQLEVKKGDNRYDIDLKNTAKFAHNDFYVARIRDAKKQEYNIRFRYNEKY